MSASTASCNIRFSFLTIMSGAPNSISLFKRLLRLMTRRYRSFRSEVAKRPPSNCTMGRNSGGMTGRTVMIIHSGLLPLRRNASMISMRLTALRRLAPLWLFSIISLVILLSLSRSTAIKSSRMASAPIPTRSPVTELSPYCSSISRSSLSLMTCLRESVGTLPGSSTT